MIGPDPNFFDDLLAAQLRNAAQDEARPAAERAKLTLNVDAAADLEEFAVPRYSVDREENEISPIDDENRWWLGSTQDVGYKEFVKTTEAVGMLQSEANKAANDLPGKIR